MAANAWEVAGTEPDAPPANDPWTVAAIEPDSTALARGADADDHASPVARTESRMGDALHTARRFLMGSTPEEEATGDYKVGVIPSVKESLGEEFKLPSLSDVGTTLKTTAARAIGGSKLQSLEELKQAHLNDAKLPAERRALWADPDFIKLKEAIDQEKATLGEVSKDEQGVSERNQGFWQQAALNAAGSLEMSAPSLAAGVLTRNPELAVASMYSPTAATSYSQRRQAGVAPELAAKSAAIDGVLEVGTELLPAHALFKQGAGPFKRMVNFLSHELPGESAAQIGQNLNQYLTELPGEATAKDVVDNLWMSVQQLPQVAASVALAGGAQVGVANLAEGKHAPSADEQGRQAEEFARRAAPDLGTPALQLEAPKMSADFEVTPEGTAKRPGEEVPERKALPAPQGSGAFVAGEQGTRELTQADERARQQAREERASLGSDNVTRVPLEALQAIQDGTATKEQVSQARAEGLVSADGSLLPVGRRQIQTLKRAKLKSSVTAETDPNAITVVPGEQGLHGVAIGGKPQAWYSSKKIATEEAQALRTALPEAQAAAPAVPPKTATVLGQEIEAPATPTAAQAEAGNYKKPVVYWHDMPIKIENVKGSTRTGPLDESGKPAWTHEMAAHYGYIQGSTATDKEGVDVYIGDHKDANKAFVIDQLTPDGKQFDEPKVVIGVKDATAASKLYLDHYPRGWKGLGAITEMNAEKLGEWAYSAAAKHPIAWQKPAEAAVSRYQEHATSLKNMAANAGWQEIGGKVITDEDAVKPAVTGRTKWVAKDQQWREAQTVAPLPKNSNGAATKAAVAKAIASEKLSAGEKRHVDALLDAEQNRHTEEQRFADLNKVSLADIDARIEQLKDLDAILSRAETHESDAEEPLFQRKKPGGQPDLFGDPVAVRNELKRLEAEKDRRRNSGQESVETGKEDDLFSKAKDQKPLFQRSDDDYRGQHTAPDREGGAPLHDVTKNGNYPEDIYSGDGARLYAHYGDSRDYEAIHAIQRVRNRPNRMVKVYRAVPHEQTSAERITQLEKQLARYQRRRIVPNGGRSGFENETAWYEGASKELEELKAQPPQSPARVKINPGDWVTTSRAYAKEHGEDHLGGKYKIISKTVMAKEVFTDANSIFEFGYYPASEAAGGEDQPLFQRNGRTVEVDGTRRPITDSTGKLLAQTTEQQRNFWRWFGNSKVVDEHGKPLVIYHGTGKKFTKFSKAKSTQGIFWVTSDRAAIESGKVGAQARGQILDLYASIKNPAGWDEYHKYGLGELKREGYDGAVLPDKDGTITAFVFESSQLKSATANRGTFDPNNPDITFRKGDQAAKGQPVAEVKAAVDTILSRFKVKPDLHVVQNFNDLPAPMLKVLAGQNVKDGDITAFYFKGGVYVIADQIKSMSEIPNTIAHEYIAHLGLRSALPRAEYVPILEGIAKDMPMEVRRRGHVEFGNDFDLKNDFHRQRAAEETLAYYAGEYMSGNSIPERIKRWVQKFIGLLRDWTREVLGMPKLHDETFLKQLLVDLETHLKSGEGHAQAASEEPAFTSKQPTFYSALTRAAESAKREKGTGKEWLATLKNMPGIKQEEIEATDLEQFLGDRVKISRQEVVDYLNHNGVQVTEKILGDQPTVEFKEFIASTGDSTHTAHIDGIEQRYPFIRYIASNNTWWVQTAGGIKTQAPDYAAAHAIAMDALHNTLEPATRYGNYTLPGGEHYRELLLTLPTSTGLPTGWKIVKHPMGLAAEDGDGDIHATGRTEQEVIQKILEYGNKGIVKTDVYRSSHWEEPNVLAHIRFDTREVQLESAKENNLGEKFLELASGVTPINGTLKIVNRGVQGMRQHAQISKAIVEAVPVDVVNSLRALKLSPEKLFSNNSVSAAFAAMPVNVRDRVINGIAAATMKTEALIRAKVLRSLSTGLDAELLPAMRTSDLDAGYVSSLLSSDETGESAILQGLESNDSGARSAASSATSIGTGSDERSAANLANLLNAHADIVRSSLVNGNRHDKRTIRVMHIAEVQSDWHQAGRKKGYGPEFRYEVTRHASSGVSYLDGFYMSLAEAEKAAKEKAGSTIEKVEYGKGIPDAPFKTTWVDLAVKRAIRFASENGFDRITWDTGATNADRYDLSKQVDGVRVMEATAADSVHVLVQPKGNTQWTHIAEGNSAVKRNGLADAIGKELAEKALKQVDAGEIAEFRGLDLKVGGTGMIGFYDKILPATANKLIKKYGGKVGNTQIDTGQDNPPSWTEADTSTQPRRGLVSVHSLDITDAMRSAAMEGQPLFQRTSQTMPLRDEPNKPEWKVSGYQALATKAIDSFNNKLGWYYGPLGKLPEQNAYLKGRYLALGDIGAIRKVARHIFDALKGASTEDAAAVYDFMTTRDATPDSIVDQKIMATAVQAKALIAEQGQRLYDAGLLSDEAMERYAGEYLPRMYLKHVLGDQMFSEMGYGKKISSQGNLKMRKDIPIETRKFILGEITDPAFLASFSVSRVGRDLAMMDFLDFVSHNQAWVPPQMMVEWNGKKVSPYWVTSEAARLRRQANFIKDHPSAGKMREIADRMDALADRAKGKLDAGVELTDFKQIPDTARYGMLRGLWIRKEIYEDLVGAQTFIEPKSFEGMVQRTSGKIMRAFKFSKVSANLPSHFRNMMGNAIMLHLSGVPFQRVYSGEIFLKAISSILHKDEYYQIAQKHGMSESSFNNNELASIRDEWLAMQESESLGNGPAKIKAMFGRVTNAIGDIYQFEEELGKLAKLRDAMERQGMPEDDAMIEAHKWTFDYSLIPRWLKFIRNTPLGAPFFTYSYKAFPRMGEALVRRPWAYLPYLAAPYLMAELMKYLWGADDDDLKKARQAAPTWMQSQGGMQLLPWKDEAGRLQMLNLGYITPWGMLADMGAQAGNNDLGGAVASTGLLSGPVPNVIAAVKTGIDPFTKKPIVPKGASPREGMEAITQYAWDMAMPGMFGSRGWYAKMRQLQKGEVNKYTGDLLLTKGQVWSQLFGLTVYPYDPEQSRELNMVFMQREIEDIQRNTKTKLRDQNLVNDEAKADQIREDAQERIRQKQEELQLYQQQSEVPKAFERDAKPKHQFLDLIGRVAPITDQKSKREAVRTILEAGHPALASLVEDLPVRLRPMVAAALREGRVNA